MRFWKFFIIGAFIVAITKTVQGSFGVERVARAIATAEGYGVPGAIPTVKNNPGNIRSLTPPYDIATYPSVEAGWAALYRQVQRMADGTSNLYPKGWTLAQVAQRYTGEARYMDWANNVARILGVSTNAIFSELVK